MIVVVDEKTALPNSYRTSNLPCKEGMGPESLVRAEEPNLTKHLEAIFDRHDDVKTASAALSSHPVEDPESYEKHNEEIPDDSRGQTQKSHNSREGFLPNVDIALTESPNGSITSNPPTYEEQNLHREQIVPAAPPDISTGLSSEITSWQTSQGTSYHPRDVGLRAMDYLTSQSAVNNLRKGDGQLWSKDGEEGEEDQEWSVASPYSVD